MAYSPLASGLLSSVAGAGDIAADRRKTAEADASAKQRYAWQKEIDLDYQTRVDELKFQREGERLPEEVRRKGLISAGETEAKIATEKTAWNDPEYRKTQSLKEGITNPDRGAGLRAEQTKGARLANETTEKTSGYTEGLRMAEANLASTSPGTAEYVKAEKDVAVYRKALDVGRPGHDDPLSSKVSAAKAILADFDSTDEQKSTARDFLSSNLKSGSPKPQSGSPKIITYEEYQALPKGTTYIAPDGQTRTKK